MTMQPRHDGGRLTTLEEITDFLQNNPQPFFYISRSPTNLVGIDRWIGGFRYVTLNDSWDGRHPRSFTPTNVPAIEPRGNLNVVNWLLANEQVQRYIAEQTPAGYRPKIIIAMFDERTERLCRELGYELVMPSTQLRERLDSKIVTTELGNDAGTPSVPNILTTVSGWEDLREQADRAGLGSNLVIQLAYGDSGRTTYFVSNQGEYDEVASQITGPQIKIMRYINHLPLAAEAIATRSGAVVGPVLREITGHPELTQYRGGWAGSEHYPGLLSDRARENTLALVERFTNRLSEEGYRGILEVSVLLDTDTGETYLGEVNPRISGSSPHSNLTPGDTTLPLFAYHILEYSDVDFDLNLGEVSRQRADAYRDETWTTLVIQHPTQRVQRVVEAPRSGRYRRSEDSTQLEFIAPDLGWHNLTDPNEVYWLRTAGEGTYLGRGLDIGLLITRTRAQEDHYALTEPTKRLILTVIGLYRSVSVPKPTVYWRAGVRKLRSLIRR